MYPNNTSDTTNDVCPNLVVDNVSFVDDDPLRKEETKVVYQSQILWTYGETLIFTTSLKYQKYREVSVQSRIDFIWDLSLEETFSFNWVS